MRQLDLHFPGILTKQSKFLAEVPGKCIQD